MANDNGASASAGVLESILGVPGAHRAPTARGAVRAAAMTSSAWSLPAKTNASQHSGHGSSPVREQAQTCKQQLACTAAFLIFL